MSVSVRDDDDIIAAVAETAGERLDVFVARMLEEVGIGTRAQAKRLIECGGATVNKKQSKAGYSLKAGDIIEVKLPEPCEMSAEPENIPLDIVYQDSDIAVINKPQGMVVHPAPGNESGTLVNAVMYHIKDLSGIGGVLRPGIVHRIDKLTSGLLVIAKNDYAHSSLAAQIKEHSARRTYICVVCGNIKEDSITVNASIGRHRTDRKKMAVYEKGEQGVFRDAITHFTVLNRFGNYTLLEAVLETGRTHQIRVHAAYIKHPVVGDLVYGAKNSVMGLSGQALHAVSLSLTQPRSGERMTFFAPLPKHMRDLLKKLSGASELADRVEERYKQNIELADSVEEAK